MNAQAIKPGHVLIEVISGAAGPCLTIGDNDTSVRLAGPKPWGGGATIHLFSVDAEELVREANSYALRALAKATGEQS